MTADRPEGEQPGWLLAAGLAAASVLLAHGLSLGAGFVWDDRHTVVANPALRSLSGLLRSFSMDDWQAYGLRARGLYRPLATASLALDQALFGPLASGFHATSLALHAFSAFALMRVLAAAGVPAALGLATGALFAVHPLTSEVADWISARPDGLSAALALGALLAALRDRPRTAALLAVAAPFAKEPGLAALPVVLLVVAARAPRRTTWQSAAILLGGAGLYLAGRSAATVPASEAARRAFDLAEAGRLGEAAWGWLAAFLFPLPLDVNRRLPELGAARWVAALLLLGVTALALLGAWRSRRPLPAALALLWALPLAVTGIFAPNLSERYLYLPTAAAAGAIGLGIASLNQYPRLTGRPSLRLLLAIAAVALGLAAAAASAARAREWSDPLSLFAGSVVADPSNPEAWQILGAEQHRQGDRAAALRSFERSAELGSARAGLYSNLCAVRREAGDLARAAEDCERAIRLDPEDPRPRYNRSLVLLQLGRGPEALAELRALTAAHPGYRPARALLDQLEGAPAALPHR